MLNAQNYEGCSPLHVAGGQANSELFMFLLKQPKIDVNLRDNRKETPVFRTTGLSEEAINALLDTGKVNLCVKNKDGITPIDHVRIHFRLKNYYKVFYDRGLLDE
ncbi:hypothetical protein B4U79_18831 [Dinothrombium tinctorium]|uniref:Uncharacterized protein n=1 Tax=Dinothrombium tinctorium TaxID=1965070 RepID=A0A443Q7T6_9ACAR|nr:hypothetical protein B4U79_18831 [Dinothrombium tinctorium]